MDLKAVEEVVASIQGQLFRNSNSYSIGMLKSHFKGSGLQFKEHQVYCHGDDVRFIDWKLLARTNTPYVKTFEEERNVDIVVVLDLSLSMFMGFNNVSKLQVAINITSLLCLLAKETNDYVQILLIGESEKILPKENGKKAIVQLISELRKLNILNPDGSINLSYRPKEKRALAKNSSSIGRFLATKKEVVLLSDMNNLVPAADLVQFSKRKNMHCFKINGPLDRSQTENYAVFGFNSQDLSNLKGQTFSITSHKEKGFKDSGARIKNLDIEGRYLEDFVKELV